MFGIFLYTLFVCLWTWHAEMAFYVVSVDVIETKIENDYNKLINRRRVVRPHYITQAGENWQVVDRDNVLSKSIVRHFHVHQAYCRIRFIWLRNREDANIWLHVTCHLSLVVLDHAHETLNDRSPFHDAKSLEEMRII